MQRSYKDKADTKTDQDTSIADTKTDQTTSIEDTSTAWLPLGGETLAEAERDFQQTELTDRSGGLRRRSRPRGLRRRELGRTDSKHLKQVFISDDVFTHQNTEPGNKALIIGFLE